MIDVPSDKKHLDDILRTYRTQVRAIVANHKVFTRKAIEEVDKRKAEKISKSFKNPNTSQV